MAGRVKILVPLVFCLAAAATASAQEVYTYTNASTGERDLALGYPVPVPVNSLTPGDFFRSYADLHARHQALAVEHPFINAHTVGRSIKGRDIWAYTVSDPDPVTISGFPEPAFFINGTIHAREWVSPEVVTGILERFAERGNDGGLYQYLVENANLVVIPVLNVDGFLQTQKYPAKVILGTDPEFPDSSPRDGRMRRKNMRGADQDLFTFGDHLNGVDLNRNNPPFAPSIHASANPNSLIFHGNRAHNQPETQALAEAVKLAPGEELRLYTDFHSFAASFFDWRTGNPRRDAIHGRLIAQAIDALGAQGSRYSRAPGGPGLGIGSTDEYFGETYQIPAWTLELEPDGDQGGTQYGGFGVTHDGFILPESEIARVREEIANTYAMLFYAQAGPPATQAVKVLDAGNKLVFAGEWQRTGPHRREFVVQVNGNLRLGGEYRLWVAFDKPMRRRDANGEISNYFGMNVALKPAFELTGADLDLSFGGAGHWLDSPGSGSGPGYSRYADDAFIAPFTVPADVTLTEPAALTLAINAQGLAEQSLDADPATVVDWGGGHWTGYESSDGSLGDSGGTDETIALTLSKQDLDTLRFEQLEYEVLEGTLVPVHLIREGSGEGAVTAQLGSVRRAIGTPVPWYGFEVHWADGETGAKVIAVSVPDDFFDADAPLDEDEVFIPSTIELGVGQVTGPALAPTEEVIISTIDNDTAELGRASVLFPALQTAVSDGSDDGFILLSTAQRFGLRLCLVLRAPKLQDRPVIINLRDQTTFELSAPVCEGGGKQAVTPSIQSRLVIAGHDSIIRLSQSAMPQRLFHVDRQGELVLSGVALEGGQATGNKTGGAILNDGVLRTEGVIFRDNDANRGGAVNNQEQATFVNSSFVNNSAAHGGGAIYNQGKLTLGGVTFSGNQTGTRGGAVWNRGQLNIQSSTFADNSANQGAGLANSGIATIGNTILDGTAACLLAGGEVTSDGYNLNRDASCGLGAMGDVAGVDAGLDAFDETSALYPLLETSPAVDAGDPAACIASDPRGAPRPFTEGDGSARCDIGAFERALTVHRGLWWNPARSGHGIDLQQTGDRLTLTWFTYEPDGDPVWYQAVAQFTDATWVADLHSFSYNFDDNEASSELVGSVSLNFASDNEATFSWDLSAIGQGTGSEPFESYTPKDDPPLFDVTGIWAAMDSSDWGLSVDVQGDIAIMTVYYYDAVGNPRWVQGVGAAVTDIEAALSSLTGFCPGCTYEEPDAVSNGRLRLQFLTRLQGQISTNFTYPGIGGGVWRREVGLGSLSAPVP